MYFTPAVVELVTLKELIDTLYAEVGWDEETALAFLLTDEEPLLPWIEVEPIIGGLWTTFRIHVGSPDATAEQVRSAYVAAIKDEFGTEVSRAPKVEDIELLFHDEHLRHEGLTWEQRWRQWEPTATSLKVNKYESWQAYRNKVLSLARRLPWAKGMLDAASKELEGSDPR